MFNYKNYNDNKFVYSKQKNLYNNYQKIDIYYNRKKIIIKTPRMMIPFDIVNNNNFYSLCISFSKKNIDKNIKEFYNFIKFLDKKNKKNINKKLIYKKSLSSFNGFDKFISLNMPYKNNNFLFDAYNENNNKINVNEITKYNEVSIIIELSYIWLNKKKAGCQWNILQIKKYNYLNLDVCLIIDDDDIEYNNKYTRMAKMGVPILAIKQNMLRDGINNTLINNLPNIKQDFIKNCNINSYSNNLNLNINLKKTIVKPKKIIDDGFAPSLKDIKNTLKNLNKINKNYN
jgi:hypothetical protein